MRLYEYQSKHILTQYNIFPPQGKVVTTAIEAKILAEAFGGPVMVKSQALVDARSRAGGIKLAKNADKAETLATRLLKQSIRGYPVESVLIEQVVDVQKEFYLSILVDRATHGPVMIACAEGGRDIEKVAREKPEAIIKLPINPLFGLGNFQARKLAYELGLRNRQIQPFVNIAQGLYRALVDNDATLIEINPLAVDTKGSFVALDGVIDLDDNALFRHPPLKKLRDEQETQTEQQVREMGLRFVKLEGNVACLVNGSGLAMATIDSVKQYGGEPANFLDVRGGAKADDVAQALQILSQEPYIKVILCNIFGGLLRCDEVAKGILLALEQGWLKQAMVVRLAGTNQQDGQSILAEANFPQVASLHEAAQKAVALAKALPGQKG